MKKIAILGSTGSIGKSTLHVVRHLKDEVQVDCLCAHSNIDLLEEQANEFRPQIVAIFDKEQAHLLQKRRPDLKVLAGLEGLMEAATWPTTNFVISAIVGSIGLIPTVEAIKAKKTIGLANKEVLVTAGELVSKLARENQVKLLPIDSEHSAIFQCLEGEESSFVRRLIITASGGPFRTRTDEELQSVGLEDALKHPTWNMGAKITVDSSTLMNKGLEVIEARWLFDISPEHIDVVIHPQSVIHSMVEFIDGSIMAQMSEPNMILPIQHVLTYPKRVKGILPFFDFTKNRSLEFFSPNFELFPCLGLALDAIKLGGSTPCYLNAANEVLVNRFLNKEISWYSIGKKLEKLMEQSPLSQLHDIDSILHVDREARKAAYTI